MTETENGLNRVMVLMFTDIEESVKLKNELGMHEWQRLIQCHDKLFAQAIAGAAGATVLKDMGDGYMASFELANEAVETALRFQHAIHHQPWGPRPIKVRIGINQGQVAVVGKEPDGGPKLAGLPVDIAARIMSLAEPGQVLMGKYSFDDARQFVRQHPAVGDCDRPLLHWVAHGAYIFKGCDDALEVFEVGGAKASRRSGSPPAASRRPR